MGIMAVFLLAALSSHIYGAAGIEYQNDLSRSKRSALASKIEVYAMDNFISLVEKIERHNKKPLITIANYIRKLGYDDAKWTTLLGAHSESLPDGILTSEEKRILTNMVTHRFAGQQELGVVHTPYGNVALGEVIKGICAGLHRDVILQLPKLYRITSKHIDNLYMVTVAGILGFTGLVHKVNPSLPLLGPSGIWSPNSKCPQIYNADKLSHSKATDAQILGSVDGFLLGYLLPQWVKRNVRLGQLLRMYYNSGVVYNKQFAACKRLDTFKKFALTTVFSDQVELAGLAAKHVWNQGNDFSRVKDADMPQLAKDTLRKFDDHLEQLQRKFSCPVEEEQDCSLPANIVFIMDESGSISSNNYQIEKDFVRKIIEAFEISSYKTRVAIVEYDDIATETIKLGEFGAKSTLMCAVDDLSYSGGGTSTSKALLTSYDILKKAQSTAGSTVNDPQIMILMTDGRSSGGEAVLRPIVQRIKKSITGLTIIAVGVGNYVMTELELIATDPKKHVLTTTDFSKLVSLVKQLRNQTCKPSTELQVDISLSTDNQEEGGEKGKAKKDPQVTGYVSPGKARYFTLSSKVLHKTGNISLEIKPSFGTVTLYGSRKNASPGPDNYDFKFTVDGAKLRQRRSVDSIKKDGKKLEFYNICKGYNSSNCPPIYLAVYGENSTNTCSDMDCSVPDQIKFEITAAKIVKVEKQEKTCYFNVTGEEIHNAAEVIIEILSANESVTLYTSRSHQKPNETNYNDILTVPDDKQSNSLAISEPCEGFEVCPPIFMALKGYEINCNCNQDNDCGVPSQIRITIKQLTTIKPKTTTKPKALPQDIHCVYNISSQKLMEVKSVNIKITTKDSSLEMFTSRTHNIPDKLNFTERFQAVVGNITSMEWKLPCSGYVNCPPLYLGFIGNKLSCNCKTAGNQKYCTLPDDVKISFTEEHHPSKGSGMEMSFGVIIACLSLPRLFKS